MPKTTTPAKIDKKRLYWLMNYYLKGEIDAWTFCNEFYECYDLKLDSKTLTNIEGKAFAALSLIAGRFSNIEEDLRKYPGTYFTEDELKQKVLETKELLNENNLFIE